MRTLFVRTLPSLMLVIVAAGPGWGACPRGDLTGDCEIDYRDVKVLAEQWLEPPGELGDIDKLNGVEWRDFALLSQGWGEKGIPLVINEFMASNSGGDLDPQGQDDDWIEIYNAGNESIDMNGMHLTDDLDNPEKWRIPDDNPSLTTIPAGGYLIIWADIDEEDYPAGLHANFQIDAGGGELGLFDSNSAILIDSVDYPDQTPNISYGRFPDGNDAWRFFGFSTHDATNLGAYLGEVADTKFSHDRGFYDASFSVTLATETEDAEIYYTIDGSSPIDIEGQYPTGTVYTTAIPISTTTCLRAVAFKPGWKPTNADAQTYIFLDDVIEQATNPTTGAQVTPDGYPALWDNENPGDPEVVTGDYQMDPDVVEDSAYRNTIKDDLKAVPTMCLNMPIDDWFGSGWDPPVGGIYMHPEWEDIYGPEAERAVSVEYFDPTTAEEFQINALVRIAGGSSTNPWKMHKLSMRLKFSGRVGPAKLEFPIFGDDAADQFNTLVLDARMNNSWAYGGDVSVKGTRPWGSVTQRDIAQYTRDQFVSDVQLAMGSYGPYGRHVHLYLNGLYWGLYWVHERPDEHFAEEYLGGEAEDYDVLKHNSSTILNGSNATYNQMFSIASGGLASNEQYQLIQEYLDVNDLIDYLIVNYYVCNTDWSQHNWYATHNRYDPAGRWRYHSWDAEHCIEGLDDGSKTDRTSRNDSKAPTGMQWDLADNDEYKLLFADHVHRHFANGGVLSPEGAAALYQIRLDEVDRAVVGESARWGDNQRSTPFTRNLEWARERNWILGTYLPQRTGIVLDQFKSRGWYPNIDPPVFYINDSYQHGGYISSTDFLSMTAGSETIHYTIDGEDPRQSTIAQITGTTLVARESDKRVLVPAGPISDNWRGGAYFDDSGWVYIAEEPGGVGYDERSDYQPYISYDVETLMNGDRYPGTAINTSAMIRVPFTVSVEDLVGFNFMTLKVQYDDGFVAFINGQRIDYQNFSGDPDDPDWDSHASVDHEAGGSFDIFDVTDDLGKLLVGDNIFAIQGLNDNMRSSDFIINAELVAGESMSSGGGVSPTALTYNELTPLTLDKSTHIKARSKNGSTWSALNEATYVVGPVAERLRITEIMYHPEDTGDPNDPNEEYIELTNLGPETINLNLMQFTNGIDFTFGDVDLGAGEYVVVVKNQAAFEAQYPGFWGVIAGEYVGRLNNGGERIELVDAMGQTILNFRYEDQWRKITDGDGYSLTIIDANDAVQEARPEEGLIGHWKLDDEGGTVATDSAGSNDGTIYGNPSRRIGQIGEALSFDGDGDYVSLSPIEPLAGSNVTVEAWIRMSGFVGVWNPILIQHDTMARGYYFYVLEYMPVFSVLDGGVFLEAKSSAEISSDGWHHVAGTNDGSNLRIYVDGILEGTTAASGYAGLSYEARIGCDLTAPTYYTGLIDDVRVYNRALAESEFQISTNRLDRWGEKDSWRASAYIGGSPGADDSGIVPNPGAVVINEVMAHSHGEAPDWIELYNTTDAEIDIGGWYLSDNEFILMKYQFAAGAKIGAFDYLVLYEDVNFGDDAPDPGNIWGFAFSENGDGAYLSSAEDDVLTGYRAGEDFGASYTGISFGRYFKRSTGNYNFVSMDHNTPDDRNAYPAVGPVVINEIMYNPDWPSGGAYGNDRYEYIELKNITAEPVRLWREDKALPWKFSDGIDFTFPDEPDDVNIAAGDYIVVVRDVNAFTWLYPSVPAEKIFGPYDGKLSNAGERVEINMPGDKDQFGRQHYIRIDRVVYSDGSHHDDAPGGVDLWPTEADGQGKSLTRVIPSLYGNDPNNWTAEDPSPGL